ncbi:LytR C-terminal domain-containing protein [Georgenia deserti]|uniref:LytR C-terminal domain-containing protein n=1 Tax=Georgenia deserti TaxID=2093781 RepID=A0ABW4L2X5_9MICO
MTTPDEYPEDEFDVAGRERSPQGVHRGARPLWRTLLPVVAVIVLAPLLAWGAIQLLGGSDDPAPTAGATETTDEATEDEATEEATEDETTEEATEEETTEEPTEEETTEDVQYDTTITVLNGAGIGGLAGQTVEQLAGEGFTNGVASDYTSAVPETTTLYYNNAELEPTAQEVASVLGITNVVESAGATEAIAIVLRSDFAG